MDFSHVLNPDGTESHILYPEGISGPSFSAMTQDEKILPDEEALRRAREETANSSPATSVPEKATSAAEPKDQIAPSVPKSLLPPDKEALRQRMQTYLEGQQQEKLSPLALIGMAIKAMNSRAQGKPLALSDLIEEHEGRRRQVATQLLDRLNQEEHELALVERQSKADEARQAQADKKAEEAKWKDYRVQTRALRGRKDLSAAPGVNEALSEAEQAIAAGKEEDYLVAMQKAWDAATAHAKTQEFLSQAASDKTLEGVKQGEITPELIKQRAKMLGTEVPPELESALMTSWQSGESERAAKAQREQARISISREMLALRQQAQITSDQIRLSSQQLVAQGQTQQAIMTVANGIKDLTTQLFRVQDKLENIRPLYKKDPGEYEAMLANFSAQEALLTNQINELRTYNDRLNQQFNAIPGAKPQAERPNPRTYLTPALVQQTVPEVIARAFPGKPPGQVLQDFLFGKTNPSDDDLIIDMIIDTLNRITGGQSTLPELAAEMQRYATQAYAMQLVDWQKKHYVQRYVPGQTPEQRPPIESSPTPAQGRADIGSTTGTATQDLAAKILSQFTNQPPSESKPTQ